MTPTSIKEDTSGVDQSTLSDLNSLYEITKLLAGSIKLEDCLSNIMEILSQHKKMENGTVTVLTPQTGRLEIKVAPGMTADARSRGTYEIGEGITGKVVETGEAILVPTISEEPLFLNKTRTRQKKSHRKSSFLCVPIKHGNDTIGALSVDKHYGSKGLYEAEQDLQFLEIVSGIIAQTAMRIRSVNKEKEALKKENLKLRFELSDKYKITNILGRSSKMYEVFEMIHRVADSNATVLLRGESGTGKTLVAKSLHSNSKRAAYPFVVVNCSALPETLMESELFGHEKGAFTGAYEQKKGRFEIAEKGTIFLDEIGELSLAVQAKLLHVVQDHTFQRVGGAKTIHCDVRIVAATNRDLEAAVAEKTFREDLYYRLNVFPIFLPSLRHRKTDIILLADFFLKKYAEENNKKINRLSTPVIDLLMQYHWPGNVRELQNCIERATLICDEESIKTYHLPPSLQTASMDTRVNKSLGVLVADFEKELIVEALKKSVGNQTKAADQLDTSLRILNYKIHKYGIDPNMFKRKNIQL